MDYDQIVKFVHPVLRFNCQREVAASYQQRILDMIIIKGWAEVLARAVKMNLLQVHMGLNYGVEADLASLNRLLEHGLPWQASRGLVHNR